MSIVINLSTGDRNENYLTALRSDGMTRTAIDKVWYSAVKPYLIWETRYSEVARVVGFPASWAVEGASCFRRTVGKLALG